MRVAAAVLLLISAACQSSAERQLVGTWAANPQLDSQDTLVLNRDGTAVRYAHKRYCLQERNAASYRQHLCKSWSPYDTVVTRWKRWRVVTDSASNGLAFLCLDKLGGIGTADCKTLKATENVLMLDNVDRYRVVNGKASKPSDEELAITPVGATTSTIAPLPAASRESRPKSFSAWETAGATTSTIAPSP